MTRQSKPDPLLDSHRAADLIAEVEATDLVRARAAIARGVQAAQDDWIPAHLIGDALALELVKLAQTTAPPMRVAAYLRALADTIGDGEHQGTTH